MANHSCSSLLSLFLAFTILLAITRVTVDGREVPTTKDADKKQPEWYIDHDGSILIPGIGRVMVPSLGGGSSYSPYFGGGSGNSGSGGYDGTGSNGGTGSYIPGGDDTFVPNPGVEVPNPAGGGTVPSAARP